jgi:hypothetical protein
MQNPVLVPVTHYEKLPTIAVTIARQRHQQTYRGLCTNLPSILQHITTQVYKQRRSKERLSKKDSITAKSKILTPSLL